MIIIKAENLSKKYKIHPLKKGMAYSTIRDELTNTIKKPFQWLIGERDKKRDLWALKDINFEIKKGEIVGIIGPNGAGKSTLLKILTRITPPTEGKVAINGRVGSLLEVGTGFHPELTGRENIYLNGAILGMKKREIEKKFDKIVEFAEIRDFLDTPAKRYSSGMYVRLAFSVAVHLEPDILLVDEVLSVGDAAFQKKSFDKMQEVTKEDRTILLVSHNMGSIQELCQKCILLDKGHIKMIGRAEDVIEKYLNNKNVFTLTEDRKRKGSGEIRFTKVVIQNENGKEINDVYSGQNIRILMYYESREDQSLKNVRANLNIDSPWGQRITSFYSDHFESIPNKGCFIINVPNFPLTQGTYSFACFANVNNSVADWVTNAGHIKVSGDMFFPLGQSVPKDQAIFHIRHKWNVIPN